MLQASHFTKLVIILAMVNCRIFAFAPKAPLCLQGGCGQKGTAREMFCNARARLAQLGKGLAAVKAPETDSIGRVDSLVDACGHSPMLVRLKGGSPALHAFRPTKIGREPVKPSEIRMPPPVHYSHLRYGPNNMMGVGVVNFSSSVHSTSEPDPEAESLRESGNPLSMISDDSRPHDLKEELRRAKRRLRANADVDPMEEHESSSGPWNPALHPLDDSRDDSFFGLYRAPPVATASDKSSQGTAHAAPTAKSNGGSPGGTSGGAASGSGGGEGGGGGKRKPPHGSAGRGEEEEEGEGPRGKRQKGEDQESDAGSTDAIEIETVVQTSAASKAERERELTRWKVVDLKEHCRKHALQVGGRKAELVQRILKLEASSGESPAAPAPARPATLPDAGSRESGSARSEREADSAEGEEAESAEGQTRADSGASQQEMLSEYDPTEEAQWSEGEAVPFSHLSATLDKISTTRKRLEIQAILTNALRSVLLLAPEDLVPFVYITLSRVAPSYEGLELGVGDSVLLQAVALASGGELKRLKEEYKQSGDLGLVAAGRTGRQQTLMPVQELTLRSVFAAMRRVAETSGKDAVKTRVGIISGLLVAASSSEAKWIVRALQGKLRVGLQEPTVIVALATALVLNPPKATGQTVPLPEERKAVCSAAADALKAALAQLPCYDKVLGKLLTHPYTALAELCPLTPGVPVKPMLAHPSKGVQEIMERFGNRSITCEFKYDGERAQLHVLSDGRVKIFSRNSEDTTAKFPDLVAGMKEAVAEGVKEMVVDCEVVAFNASSNQILPFQTLSTRARKNVVFSEIKVQVRVYAFDLLFIDGQSLLKLPLVERRERLRSALRETELCTLVTCQDSSDPEAVQDFLVEAVQEGCEGLMVKGLDGASAMYEPDKRSREWLKVKKDYIQGMADSFDLVLVAAWKGRGKRTGLFGAFLLACYNPDKGQFESVCRLGTGFSDQQLANFSESLSPLAMAEPSPDVDAPTGPDQPDVWFDPKIVFEVEAADLSLSPRHRAGVGVEHPCRGVALRFPRFLRVREDKNAQSATQTEQVLDMYRKQASLSPTAQKPRDSDSEATSESA